MCVCEGVCVDERAGNLTLTLTLAPTLALALALALALTLALTLPPGTHRRWRR